MPVAEDRVPRLGIIGFGRIGRRLATRFGGGMELVALLVRPSQVGELAAGISGVTITGEIDAFLRAGLDVVAECAAPAALREYGPRVLLAGIDLLPLSLVALADDSVLESLERAATTAGSRVLIPPGAIGTLDIVAAAREGGLVRVLYRTVKPVAAWRNTRAAELADLDAITRSTVVFRGSAREGARLFPRNLNVAVAIALAGLGLDRTEVELLADPDIGHMTHELELESGPGQVKLHIRGREIAADGDPADFTAYGVIRVIRRHFAQVAV